LKLRGLPNVEEKTETIHNVEFLQMLMDIQERIEECSNKEELYQIKREIELKIKLSKDQIEKYFSNEEISKVLEILKSIKFHLTILEQINNKI